MIKEPLNLRDIEKLAEKTHDGEIRKKLKINSDSKNLFVRIPREMVEYLKMKKGDEMIMILDTKKEEAIIQCQLIKT